MNTRYHKFILNGGLTLITAPMEGVESATILIMVRTGSRDEPKKLAGISHFLEHMVFKGTKKYPSALSLASAIDSIGGEFNAFTSREFTGFYVKLASKHLERGLDVLSEMLIRPKLSKDDIEREKGVVTEEINLYEDLPIRKVANEFERLIYGNNSLGRETIGSKETVTALTREDLVSYLVKRYTSKRVVIGIAGGFGAVSVDKIKQLVGKAFSQLKEAGDAGYGKRLNQVQREPAVSLFSKETGQAHFVLGVKAYARGSEKRFALAVLSNILGGNMSSRLFSEIRERRGLAYYVKSDVDTFFDTGSFMVQAGVDVAKLPEALEVTLKQFKLVGSKAREGGISQEELERGKEYIKGRIILNFEDSREVADHFVRRLLLERKILTLRQVLAKIEAVTLDEVVGVARELFVTSQLNLAVVGPYKKRDRQTFTKLLRI